jgi:hypothetical protein
MNQSGTHEIKFIPSGRGQARCKPNPHHPHGIKIRLDAESLKRMRAPLAPCVVKLPYPAPECGWFEVKCRACGLSVAITAAGRPDDPVSAELPCLPISRKEAH